MTKFDPFMDYRLVFYTQDLSEMTKNLVENDEAVMLRSSESAGEMWYSLIMQSPSGKIFEIVSTKLDLEKLEAHEKGSRFLAKRFKSWASEEESCARTQAPSLGLKYTAAELDEWAEAFGAQGGGQAEDTPGGAGDEGRERSHGVVLLREDDALPRSSILSWLH